MPSTIEKLQTAVDKAEANAQALEDVINGAINADVALPLGGTQPSLKKALATASGKARTNFVNPLDLPTHPGTATCTHPGVLRFDEPWNGYLWWMAFTPWPTGAEELPNIVASNDGKNWEVPAGLTNPLITFAEVTQEMGFSYGADCDLVMLPNGDMMCYYILVGVEPTTTTSVYAQTSSDGVTWSEPFALIASGETDPGRGSPAIEREEDGTYTMWANQSNAPNIGFHRWTSPDGLTWTYDQICNIAETPRYNPNHLDVVRAGSLYHALILTNPSSGARLRYYYSEDGINFKGGEMLPLSGEDWDGYSHYRGCLVPRNGSPLAFDIYCGGRPVGFEPPAGGGGAPWTIGLFERVEFGRTLNSQKTTFDEVFDILKSTHDYRIRQDQWFSTPEGSPTATWANNSGVFISTGAGANGGVTYQSKTLGAGGYAWHAIAGEHYENMNWNRPFRVALRFVVNPMQALAELHFHVGGHGSSPTVGEDMDRKGIGAKIVGDDLYVQVHDGTTLTSALISASSITASLFHEVVLTNLGGGFVRVELDGEIVGTYAGGPEGVLSYVGQMHLCFYNAAATISSSLGLVKLVAQALPGYDVALG